LEIAWEAARNPFFVSIAGTSDEKVAARAQAVPLWRQRVESKNAFIGKINQPATKEIAAALGPAAVLWDELLAWFAAEHGVATQEWKSYSAKYGWSLQLKLKKRTIVHMGPYAGSFLVAYILGDKAVKAALASDLPKSLANTIAEAPRYPEGTGIRLVIKTARDLAAVRQLAPFKLLN
jgi:hypothetical protein